MNVKIVRGRTTLRTRFALWSAALLLTSLVLFGGLVYLATAQGLSASLDDSLQLSASQAAATVVENNQLSISDDLPMPSTLSALGERNFTIRIFGLDGTLLRSVGTYSDMNISTSILNAALEGTEAFSTVLDSAQQTTVRWYTAPIAVQDRILAVVQVGQSRDAIEDTLEQLLTTFLVSIPLLVSFAAVGGYFLAKRALAPIDAIRQTAQEISVQDLQRRLNLPASEDEVGRLGATFDTMLDRLEQSFIRERQFTADASHELRTPLTAMQTIISVTRGQARSTEEYERVLDDFAHETQRLKRLVEDLLQLARDDMHMKLLMKPVNVFLLLNDIVSSMLPLIESRQLRLDAQIAPSLFVNGDEDSLIRLFMNVLDNAIKYTTAGHIRVQAVPLKDSVRISITDTGSGIAEEHLSHVFDRFYREDTSRSSTGTGLGLSIAHAIVQAHQGTIHIASEIGSGTTVTINLPV